MVGLDDILSKRGSTFLGQGDFSIVLTEPECPHTAIKIGHSLSDGWPVWASHAVENPGPHVPIVYSLRWHFSRRGTPLFYVAEMERLLPTDEPRTWFEECPQGKHWPLALAAHLDQKAPGIARMLRQARNAFPCGHFDMGGSNWLARPNGTLVLTDPLSWRARVGPTTHVAIPAYI